MGYRVHRNEDTFKVVEVVNGEIKDIKIGLKEERAKEISRTLNFGSGFDGWTPNFFCQTLEQTV